jgi:hypothetical protein
VAQRRAGCSVDKAVQAVTGPLTRSLTNPTDVAAVFKNHGQAVPSPAPVGYRWQISRYNGVPETYMGNMIYYLERVA